MALICFDTNFVIWGIKQEASPGQEHCIKRANYVIEQCEENGDQIVVPALVVGEALCAIPENERSDFVRFLPAQGCLIMPYDSKAAIHYAKMWSDRNGSGEFSREEMKTDYLIAAVALANDCRRPFARYELVMPLRGRRKNGTGTYSGSKRLFQYGH